MSDVGREAAAHEVRIEDPAAVLAALDRAKRDAKQFREERDALQAQVAELTTKVESLEAQPAEYREALIRAEARSRLLGEGVKDPDRILKYLPVSDVEYDAGEFKGLKEALKGVKQDFPELFDPKRRAASVDATAQSTAQPMTGTEAQVARLFQRVS